MWRNIPVRTNFWSSGKWDLLLFSLGWTGHISTSWEASAEASPSTQSGAQKTYDGNTHVLYWADAFSEVAFVVPSSLKQSAKQRKFNANTLSCRSTKKQFGQDFYFDDWLISAWNESSWAEASKRADSSDLDKHPIPPKRGNKSNIHPDTNTKIMVVWLESFEDHLNLPIGWYWQVIRAAKLQCGKHTFRGSLGVDEHWFGETFDYQAERSFGYLSAIFIYWSIQSSSAGKWRFKPETTLLSKSKHDWDGKLLNFILNYCKNGLLFIIQDNPQPYECRAETCRGFFI